LKIYFRGGTKAYALVPLVSFGGCDDGLPLKLFLKKEQQGFLLFDLTTFFTIV
jgi:hypothetical protein